MGIVELLGLAASVSLLSGWRLYLTVFATGLAMHFGAVDQIATVWLNGRQVAHHEGGYTEFSADVTAALRGPGPQEIIVRARDRNEANAFPVGKQRTNPRGLFYTGASGIWQTVWMEPVRAAHIDRLDIVPDLTGLTVTPRVSGTTIERAVAFVAQRGGRVVAMASGAAGRPIRLPIPAPHLWTPDDPYLYDLKVALVRPGGAVVDVVSSYSGLRTIGTVPDAKGRPMTRTTSRITERALSEPKVMICPTLSLPYFPAT